MNTDLPETRSPPLTKSRRAALWLLLALATLLAGTIRYQQIHESLWIDELHTSWTVSDGPAEIPWRTRIGNQSPLYFYLVWATTSLLGQSEFSLRLLSQLAGTLLVPLAAWLVLRWTGSLIAALLVAALATIDSYMLIYSLEARPYALVQLVGLLHVWLFWQVLTYGSIWRRAGWIALGAVLFYLHYTAILLVAAELVCYSILACWKRSSLAHKPLAMLLDTAFLTCCCLPAVGHLREIAVRRDNWAHFIPRYPSIMIFRWDLYVGLPLAILAAAAAVFWAAGKIAIAALPRVGVLVLAVCWAVVPPGILWLATVNDVARIFMVRYAVVSWLALIVIAGLCCGLCRGRIARGVLALAMLIAAVMSGGTIEQFRRDGRFMGDHNEDWRGAVQAIQSDQSAASLPVFVLGDLIESTEEMYQDDGLYQYSLLPVKGLYRLKEDRLLVPLPSDLRIRLTNQQRQAVWDARGAWLLMRVPRRKAGIAYGQLRHLLKPHQVRDYPKQFFGNLILMRLTINYAEK